MGIYRERFKQLDEGKQAVYNWHRDFANIVGCTVIGDEQMIMLIAE